MRELLIFLILLKDKFCIRRVFSLYIFWVWVNKCIVFVFVNGIDKWLVVIVFNLVFVKVVKCWYKWGYFSNFNVLDWIKVYL